MADVRGDSLICVQDPTGTIKTVIAEANFDDYKAKGWSVIKDDWTKDRTIRPPVDFSQERDLRRMGQN